MHTFVSSVGAAGKNKTTEGKSRKAKSSHVTLMHVAQKGVVVNLPRITIRALCGYRAFFIEINVDPVQKPCVHRLARSSNLQQCGAFGRLRDELTTNVLMSQERRDVVPGLASSESLNHVFIDTRQTLDKIERTGARRMFLEFWYCRSPTPLGGADAHLLFRLLSYAQ